MRKIGLTGGIACGKSTVAKMFKDIGAPVVDADALARQVVEPGTVGFWRVAEAFPEVVRKDISLDRQALRTIIINDKSRRKRLEAITHPLIKEAFDARSKELKYRGHKALVFEAALLLENDGFDEFDLIVTVEVPRIIQMERLMKRDNMDAEAALKMIDTQMRADMRAIDADIVLDSLLPEEILRRKVARIWKLVTA